MKHICILLLLLLLCPMNAWAQDIPQEMETMYPGYAFVQGDWTDEMLCVVMRAPDGRLVVIGGVKDRGSGTYLTHQSTPLPEGTEARIEYAMEDDTFTLFFNGEIRGYCLAPYGKTWGIVMDERSLGHFWLRLSGSPNGHWCFGSHPWNDFSTIDWATLPQSQQDVLAVMNMQDWATPNNPNHRDRLHLRAAPREDAVSLGKYYNGTPIKVLEYGETWTHVSIFDIEGYMMSAYLSFGKDMVNAVNGLYRVAIVEKQAELYEWPADDAQHTTIYPERGILILGDIGNEWVHIWSTETGESGYLRVQDVLLGNG